MMRLFAFHPHLRELKIVSMAFLLPMVALAEVEPMPGEVDPVSVYDIRVIMIEQSVSSFGRKCPCPYSPNGFGGQCGTESYYYKPGGYRLYCYLSDVRSKDVLFFMEKNGYPYSLRPDRERFEHRTIEEYPTIIEETITNISPDTHHKNAQAAAMNPASSTATTTTTTSSRSMSSNSNSLDQNSANRTSVTTTTAGPAPSTGFISNYQQNTPPDWNKVLTK